MKSQTAATINSIDHKLLLTIQTWRKPALNKTFLVLTYSGTGKAWLIFAVVLNLLNHQGFHFIEHQAGFMKALISPLVAWTLSSILKRVFSRPRPSLSIEGYESMIPSPTCSSFPSSHAAAAMAFFIALILIHHPFSVVIGIWAFLVSFSRLYLGVHYLSDVLGGSVLGALSAWITMQLVPHFAALIAN